MPAPGHCVQPGPAGPRLTPPPLGKLLLPHGLSLRCVTVCASVSISERMPSPVPCPSPALRLSVSRSVSPSLCLSLPVCACALVSVCLSVSVCICLAPSWECVSEPSSLSVSVSPDPRPPTGAMAVALAAALAPAGCLPWRGCLRVSVCLSVCLHVARLLPPEGPVLGGRRGGKGGLGRAKGRGGADELLVHRAGGSRWLWAPGRCRAGWALRATAGLRTGPQEAQRTAGPSGPRSQRAPGPRGPEQRRPRWGGGGWVGGRRGGEGGEVAEGGGGLRAGPGLEGPRVGERQDLRPASPLRAPHPTPPHPTPPHPTPDPPQACRAGCSGSRVPGPGSPVVPRAGPGGCWPGVAVCGGRSGVGRPHGRRDSGRGSCSSSAARAPWRAAAGWAERQVGAKGRRSAGLLGRPAAAAPVYGHTTLNAPDLV